MFFFLRHAKFFSAFAILAILAIVLTAALYYGSANDPWKEFKTKNGKDYGGKEDARRKQIFHATDAKIKKHNSQKNVTYHLGHNKFSDRTAEELTKYVGAVKPDKVTSSSSSTLTFNMTDPPPFPATFDYRNNPCMPAVKNQGDCDSCSWAFSAITPIEYLHCMKHSAPVVLSEQQLIDCDPISLGYEGGQPTDAWKYLQNTANGSTLQSLYPYTAKKDTCKDITYIAARVFDYGSLNDSNVLKMQITLMMIGPISVSITVDNDFSFYRSGVYTNTACDNSEDYRFVVVVGWGTDGSSGLDYWIVRNSWGSQWGMDGYILIQRGVNKCKIETNLAAVSVV